MRPLSVPELLNIWERGVGLRPFEKALTILDVALPELSASELYRMSVGRRDASLFKLREWAFGPNLSVLASCPRCRQQLEITLPVAALLVTDREPSAVTSLHVGDYEVRCRLPNSEDLAACNGCDFSCAWKVLLARCTVECSYRGLPVETDQLPAQVADAVAQHIAICDAQADTRVNLRCPECQHSWSEMFDIVSFFWTEIDAWARRVFREVHILASTYGWSESAILNLKPTRREIYLAMAQA